MQTHEIGSWVVHVPVHVKKFFFFGRSTKLQAGNAPWPHIQHTHPLVLDVHAT